MQGEMGGMEKIQLTNEKLIGNGSFGVVVQVRRAARTGRRAPAWQKGNEGSAVFREPLLLRARPRCGLVFECRRVGACLRRS